jgi:hypothetical protein
LASCAIKLVARERAELDPGRLCAIRWRRREMLVTWQRRYILEAAMAAWEEIVERLPWALASPIDWQGAIWSLGGRGGVFFPI